MSGGRPEIISLRLSGDEKRRMSEAAGRYGKSLSDWCREALLSCVDEPYVFPGQTINVSLQPAQAPAEDLIRALRLTIAALEGKGRVAS